ncbi:glycosyltransferase [bacterium]|nr:glycosyltransferase [bacterium]
MDTRVLILSASLGEGHRQASVAIEDELRRQCPSATVHVADFGEFLNHTFYSLMRFGYLQSLRLAPRIYGDFYRRTMAIAPDSRVQRRLNRLGLAALHGFIADYDPDLVICTYPTPAGVLSRLRELGATRVPVATIVTDYTVHSQWLHPAVDMYFVGAEQIREAVIQRGFDPARIHATGIPIRHQFAEPLDRRAARQQLGLDPDRPVLLMMGGAYGVLPRLGKMPRLLRRLPPEVQVLVVCGRDPRSYRRFQREALACDLGRMRVFGFVEPVHLFMAASDLVVTKAGGLTTSEALAMNLPMLIFRPLPGQEEQNTRFLTSSGAAVVAHRTTDLRWALSDLLTHPEQLEVMREAAARVARPRAAETIVATMLGHVQAAQTTQRPA